MEALRKARLTRRFARAGTAVVVVGLAVQLSAVVPAWADAANPNPDSVGTVSVNADGTATASLHGTWTWVGQSCEGRYGEGWAVDWWGISSSKTPSPSFSLTNASAVTSMGTTTTTTISPAGAIQLKTPRPAPKSPAPTPSFFHVAKYYAGEAINSPSTCTDSGSGKTITSRGSWSATATYPSLSVVPPKVCVNIYDEHGKEGQPSTTASDLSPVNDHDNSIQTNAFDPTVGQGFCVHLQNEPTIQGTIQGGIYLCPDDSPTTTLAAGGTISVPSLGLSSLSPLTQTSVSAGTYTMIATPPDPWFAFVPCHQTGVTFIGGQASQAVTVPSNGAGDGRFYVVPIL